MKKKIITTLLLFAIIMLISTTGAYANFQIRPDRSQCKYSLESFIYSVRGMEADGQVMGLNETYDSSTLKATSDSNNIDVHLTKNTEFGATLLLSASPKYGKQGEGTNSYIDQKTTTGIATTTGNQYGVYQMGSSGGDWEWVAGGSATTNYLDKYYNKYTSESSKRGDATIETQKWKGAKSADFANHGNHFYRGATGAFSYSNMSLLPSINSNSYYRLARASVVCGQGF